MTPAALEELSRASGLPLEAYRRSHVFRSVRRALEREHLIDQASLAAYLRNDEAACSRFRRSIAVSVSRMFRDPGQFELLEHELLPLLLADGRELTVWSAGCADGSELASLALLLDRLGAIKRASLLGSDVLVENLVAATRLARDGSLAAQVRSRLRWEHRDLVRDGAPEGPWRLVICRNLAIYLNPEAKTTLHATLAGALASDGVLLLGRSERLSSPQALGLERVGAHAYRKVRG